MQDEKIKGILCLFICLLLFSVSFYACNHCCMNDSTILSQEEIERLKKNEVPKHIAIITDGNRRWSAKNKLAGLKDYLTTGHWAGASAILPIVKAAKEMGVKVLTVWGSSTENLLRPRGEVETLFQIYEVYLKENRQKMIDEGVKFDTIGDLSPLPQSVKDEIQLTLQATAKCCEITLVAAINYGGRDDIRRACQKVAKECVEKRMNVSEITEESLQMHLDTKGQIYPDLLIRTSGELRISNFLLWQVAYSEIFVTDILWPDFKPRDLAAAIFHFQNRERRHGR